MFLTATNQTIELVSATAARTQYVISYVDNGLTSLTPGSSTGTITTATDTTAVAAPAASTTRRVEEMFIRNVTDASFQTLTIQKDVAGTETRLSPPIELGPGQMVYYSDKTGFTLYDSAGRVLVRDALPPFQITPVNSPFFCQGVDTPASNKTLTSGECFALYMGVAPRALKSIMVSYRVTSNVGSTTWTEVGIASGVPDIGSNPTLTVRGYADVGQQILTSGIKNTTVYLNSSFSQGEDVWVLIANSGTTPTIRAQSIADDIQAGFQAAATMRPSSNVGTPVAFTIEGATVLAGWFTLQW
jgi:hypothetical protein